MAPPCRLIQNQLTTIVVPVFDWQLILMESRPWSPGFWGSHHPFVGSLGLQASCLHESCTWQPMGSKEQLPGEYTIEREDGRMPWSP